MPSPTLTRYIVITPVRDEEKYLETTIKSVAAQTVCPAEWVIVDDGSSDGTPKIIENYAARYDWIRPKYRSNRGFRKSGVGVVEAFYDGFRTVQVQDWDFLVKLDGDLRFNSDYFLRLFEIFESEPMLGIGGGVIYHEVRGRLEEEVNPRFHVRGATKVYRRACWEAIGGLQVAPGWDIVDEVKANMLGWKTESFSDLQVIHHRFTGTAESKFKDMVKGGRACYFAGYHPLFMAAKCLYRLASRPYVFGSFALAYGFLSSYVTGMPQVADRPLIEYLRREQLRGLYGAQTIWK
jgi:glycosyltransferase involved in cell wall biosynthesis